MIPKGSIVLYKNQPALVTETGEKYTVTFCAKEATATKKAEFGTQKVRDKDITLLSQGPVSSLSPVLEAAQDDGTTDAFKAGILDAWELLSSDDDTASTPHPFSDILDYASGGTPAERVWAFYQTLLRDEHFLAVPGQQGELPVFKLRTAGEIEELRKKADEKNREGEIRAAFINRLKQKKLDLPQDGKFMQEVEALALGSTDKSKVMKEAGFKETPEKAHKLLLDTGIWPLTKNPHPARHGLSTQSATETLPSPPDEERLTVTHTAYAIDNAWSTDPDDAIAFDGTYLWVHVADPASTVTPGSKIDISARDRGSTLYIPEGAARMLSEECLEDYALGLCEYGADGAPTGKKSRALSFRILLDENGAIADVAVFKTLVHIERLTYERVDELVAGAAAHTAQDSAVDGTSTAQTAQGTAASAAENAAQELSPLFTIAGRNIERRKNAGAVFIELPEVHLWTEKTERGVVAHIEPETHPKSAGVVREMMLLAGEAAARFAFKNAIPFPYVSQEAPSIPKDLPGGLAGQYRLRRSMRSRSVGVTPSQHAGLGLGMYSQVTSPLRRYSDLVAHQQLRAFIDKKPLLNKDEMLTRISAGDAAGGATNRAARESDLHWTLVYLAQHLEWTGEAVVVEERGRQVVALIPALAQETVLTPNRAATINQTLTVRAGNINIPELTVTFQEV